MATVERPRRPASVLVLAILQILVGVVGLGVEGYWVVNDLQVVNTMAAKTAGGDPVLTALRDVYYYPAELTASAAMLILSLALIADGVGLLGMRRWGYNLGVLYGWLGIAFRAGWLGYLLLVALPVISAGHSNAPLPPELSGKMEPQAYRNYLFLTDMALVVATGVALLYPIFVLVMLAVTRKAFRRPKAAPEGAVEAADFAPAPPAGPDDRTGMKPA